VVGPLRTQRVFKSTFPCEKDSARGIGSGCQEFWACNHARLRQQSSRLLFATARGWPKASLNMRYVKIPKTLPKPYSTPYLNPSYQPDAGLRSAVSIRRTSRVIPLGYLPQRPMPPPPPPPPRPHGPCPPPPSPSSVPSFWYLSNQCTPHPPAPRAHARASTQTHVHAT